MKKRIFLYVPYMDFGGQERFVSNLTAILKDDYDLKVILDNDEVINYPLDCEYFSLRINDPAHKNKFLLVTEKVFRLRKLMRKYRPSLSISFGNSANLINLVAGTGICQVMVAIRGFSSLDVFRKENLKGVLWRTLIRQAHRIICVSRVMAEELKTLLPSCRNKICVLYNAYDVPSIGERASQETEIDSWLEKNQVIATVGTLRQEKGYWHLMKAFSLLKKTRNDIRLLHIGPDYQDYGSKVRMLIHKLGLENEVRLLGYKENPHAYCAKSKIYVLSSISEGFPNALVEAMACGLPVIAADCKSGPREILTEKDFRQQATEIEYGEYGILTPPLNKTEDYNPQTLVKEEELFALAMGQLLDNRDLAEEYAGKARRRAADFSYAKCREEIIRIIENN